MQCQGRRGGRSNNVVGDTSESCWISANGKKETMANSKRKNKNEIHYKCVVRGKNYYIVRRSYTTMYVSEEKKNFLIVFFFATLFAFRP